MIKPRALSVIAIIGLFGNNSFANDVVVNQSDSGKVPLDWSGIPGIPSKYKGDRNIGGIKWKPWSKEMEGLPPLSPRNYGLFFKDKDGKELPTSINGYNANLEKNTPFENTSNKIIGLYLPEWAYWERQFPAEFTPAKNITHVFYSFLGMCDYERAGATENNGLKSIGNDYGAAILKAMCGRGKFPGKTGPNYDQDEFNKFAWEDQDVGVKEDNDGKPKKDFEITKYDPQASYFMLKAMKDMKKSNPKLKAMASIGGWTLSSPFHAMSASPEGRKTFVKSVIKFLKENPVVDGIDIDWEFPGGGGAGLDLAKSGYLSEKSNYTALIKELRSALDQNFTGDKKKQLSAAVSGSPAKLASIDFNALKDDFDFVNVLSYDFYGAWDRNPGHHAALHAKPVAAVYGSQGHDDFVKDEAGNDISIGSNSQTNEKVFRSFSAEGAIKSILENNPNFPSQKLVLGAAAYGRGWHTVKVKKEHDKLFWHGNAAGTNGELGVNGTYEKGSTDFREIYEKYMAPGKTSNLYYDEQAQAAYRWEPKGTNGDFISATVESFDSPRSVIAKAKFVKDNNLGGMFGWEASGDNGLILNAMNAGLCNKKSDGNYYNFEESYAGVVKSQQNGVASVLESISTSPQDTHYKFSGAEFCETYSNPSEILKTVSNKGIVSSQIDRETQAVEILDTASQENLLNALTTFSRLGGEAPAIPTQVTPTTFERLTDYNKEYEEYLNDEETPVAVMQESNSNEPTSVTFINNHPILDVTSATQNGVWGTRINPGESKTYTIDDTSLLNKPAPWGYKEGDKVPLSILINGIDFKECGITELNGKITVTYYNNGSCSITKA